MQFKMNLTPPPHIACDWAANCDSYQCHFDSYRNYVMEAKCE